MKKIILVACCVLAYSNKLQAANSPGYTINPGSSQAFDNQGTYFKNYTTQEKTVLYDFLDENGNIASKSQSYHILQKIDTSNDWGSYTGGINDFANNNTNIDITGGAVYNQGTITVKNSVFANNSAVGSVGLSPPANTSIITYISGGAIHNTGTISDTIEGAFINNSANANILSSNTARSSVYAAGGAIHNKGTINNINADFIDNRVEASKEANSQGSGGALGGAVFNDLDGTINTLSGNFINNSALNKTGNGSSSGGAIYNRGDITKIEGYFESNSAGYGGAIDNAASSKVGIISGIFINNLASSQSNTDITSGGAIYTNMAGSITGIEGYFEGNSAGSRGGAIDNNSKISYIDGTFISNSAGSGGAIYSSNSETDRISGIFIGNSSQSNGGALYTNGGKEINGSYINNYANNGGAIYTSGVEKVSGQFINNHATNFGGAINLIGNRPIQQFNADFYGNYSSSSMTKPIVGGALSISSLTQISNLKGRYIKNYVEAESHAFGGAIGNETGNKIERTAYILDSDPNTFFESYRSVNTQNNLTQNISNSVFSENKAISINGKAQGGAIAQTNWRIYNNQDYASSIFNNEQVVDHTEYDYAYQNFLNNLQNGSVQSSIDKVLINKTLIAKDTDFIKNSAISHNDNAYGGAIYNYEDYILYGDSSFLSDKELKGSDIKLTNSNFIDNNATAPNGEAKGGAIYTTDNLDIIADSGTSLFSGNTANGKSNAIYMASKSIYQFEYNPENDEMTETEIPGLTTQGSLTLNAINNGVITFNDGIDGDQGYKLILKGDTTGIINLNNEIRNAEIISGDSVVIYNGVSPQAVSGVGTTNIALGEYLNHNNSLTMNSGQVNIQDLGSTKLNFKSLAFNGGILNIKKTEVDLYAGNMGGISSDNYTSGNTVLNVETVDVKTDKAGSTDVNFTNNLIADHVVNKVTTAYGPVYGYDVSYNPATGDFSFVNTSINPETETSSVAGVVAASVLSDEIYSRVLADIDGLHEDRDSIVINRGVGRTWVKTFGSDESIDLDNFQGVDSKFYGLIAGIESGRVNEGQGWTAVYNAYGAYVQGEQKFSGEKVEQLGGYIGVGATFYKGDFFAGATANVGTLRNEAKTVDGDDKFNSYLGGVGMKIGYNYKIMKDLILQPNVYGSYTYVDVNDYTTGKGAKVEVDGIHNIEIAPGFKLAKDFGEDSRGYFKSRYVFNFSEGQDATANNIEIPNVEMKNYVEYGLGYEQLWSNYDISAFIELMRRDGGREGWSATAGLKWNFR